MEDVLKVLSSPPFAIAECSSNVWSVTLPNAIASADQVSLEKLCRLLNSHINSKTELGSNVALFIVGRILSLSSVFTKDYPGWYIASLNALQVI